MASIGVASIIQIVPTERKTIEGWIDKAYNHLQTARDHANSHRCSEAVEAAQECIELSVKSVLALLGVEYPVVFWRGRRPR
jgi:HEPN domain-containing protein